MMKRITTKSTTIKVRPLEIDEFITMSGNKYVREHLSEAGWAREHGFLERRRQRQPVPVERRRGAS